MKKAMISILLFMMLLLVVSSMSAVSANGNGDEISIKFRALAVGKCFTGYGDPGPGYPDPYEWYGIGRGTSCISGKATAVPLEGTYIDILGDNYISDSVKAHGHIFVRWTEEDGSKHLLLAVIYSTATSGLGLFVPEADSFFVPIAEHPDTVAKALRFKGIHISSSKIERLSGIALFCAWPVGFSPVQPPTSLIGIGVYLLDEASQRLYLSIWLSEQADLPIDGPDSPTIPVPAAKILKREVKTMNKP